MRQVKALNHFKDHIASAREQSFLKHIIQFITDLDVLPHLGQQGEPLREGVLEVPPDRVL